MRRALLVDRFDEFSPKQQEALRDKICSNGSRSAGVLAWNLSISNADAARVTLCSTS